MSLGDPRTWPEQLVTRRNEYLRAILFGRLDEIEPARAAWIEERKRWES